MKFFKCDGNVGFREDLFGLSIETKWIWIFILGLMSKKQSGEFEIDLGYISYHNNNLEISKIEKSLNDLIDRKLVSHIPEKNFPDQRTEHLDNFEAENLETLRNSENLEETFTECSLEKKRKEKKREEKNRKEEIAEYSFVDDFFKPIRHQDIIALWNRYFPDKLFRGISLGAGKHAQNFEIANGFVDLAKIEQWEEMFKQAKESEFLEKAGWFDLTWVINYDNAVNVLNGKYSQTFKTDSPKEKTQKVRVDLIMKVLSAGFSSIKDIPGDFGLTEFETDFIRNNGGLKQLGQQNQFAINQLISAAS